MPAPEQPPFPVIVGAARSGTTLLRVMLSRHPDLAIPPESWFLVPLTHAAARYERPDGFDLSLFADDLLAHRRFRDWQLDEALVRERLHGVESGVDQARADALIPPRESSYHTHLAEPLGTVRNWRTSMKPGDVALVELVASDALAMHGYELAAGSPSALSRLRTWGGRVATVLGRRIHRARRRSARRREPTWPSGQPYVPGASGAIRHA